MIVNFKSDNDYDMIVNMDNVLHVIVSYEGGYTITFLDNRLMKLSWK